MSHYLITGGAGFIGSSIAKYLIAEGNRVSILDNFYSSREESLDFTKGLNKSIFELIKGDITNPIDCARACEGIDYVLHHAALRSVPGSMKEPFAYNKVNIDGTLNMLEAAAKAHVKRFVFASTSAIYGDTNKFPQQEEHLPLLLSPYALTKLAGEYYCRIYAEFYGLETICLRYFNVFGPGQAINDEYAMVIPKFIQCVLSNEQPPIFGNGKQSRDFVYIQNVIQANILAATTKGIKHEIFNVANGQEQTVLHLVDVINQILGKNIQPKFLPIREGDAFRTSADISKIQRLLNYQPHITFEEGMRHTIDYLKK